MIAVLFGGPVVVYGLICGNRDSESLPASRRKLKATGDSFEYRKRYIKATVKQRNKNFCRDVHSFDDDDAMSPGCLTTRLFSQKKTASSALWTFTKGKNKQYHVIQSQVLLETRD